MRPASERRRYIVTSSLIGWAHTLSSVYAPSQWETTLHCNVVSHWLGAYIVISVPADVSALQAARVPWDSAVLQLRHKQRVFMHGHQGWNVRHGLCHIYMIYVYIWVVHSFCLFCCLFIIVTTQFVALYEPCKPKPKPKPSTYDTRTTTPWQRSKFRYLDRSQSNKYAINMQIQTISVSK